MMQDILQKGLLMSAMTQDKEKQEEAMAVLVSLMGRFDRVKDGVYVPRVGDKYKEWMDEMVVVKGEIRKLFFALVGDGSYTIKYK